MDKKLVYGIAVLITAIALLAFKVITIDMITDNWVAIGTGALAIYKWLESDKEKEKNKMLNTEVEQLKRDNFKLSNKQY